MRGVADVDSAAWRALKAHGVVTRSVGQFTARDRVELQFAVERMCDEWMSPVKKAVEGSELARFAEHCRDHPGIPFEYDMVKPR